MSLGKVGKYELLDRLSAGGMGELFRARTMGPGGFERILALKVIRKEVSGDPSFVSMFIAEAKVASLLSHQNLVHLYDFGSDAEAYYLAMEMVEGHDLAKVLKRTREERAAFPIPVATYIGREVARGLDFLHRVQQKGEPLRLIHRDVSPQNIMVSYDGAVKLTDFGIVRMSARGRVTRLGVVKGKAGYLSPEQVMDRPIDARSDLFSLGIVLWETLTGARLFPGGSDLEVVTQTLQKPIRPPSSLNPDVPADLDAVVLKALTREREARFSSAAEMARALEACAGQATEAETLLMMRQLYPDSQKDRTLGLSSSVSLVPAETSEVRKFLGLPAELETIEAAAPETVADRALPPPLPVLETKPEPPLTSITAPLSSDEVVTVPLPRRRSRLLATGVGLSALVVAVVAIGGWMQARRAASLPIEPEPEAKPVVAAAELPPLHPPEAPAPAPEFPTPPQAANKAPKTKPTVAAPTRKHVAPAYGQLIATGVQPWAEVIVDGHSHQWFTAGHWKVPAGHHQVTLSNPQAGIERRFEVDLGPGGRVFFSGDLKSLQPRSEE